MKITFKIAGNENEIIIRRKRSSGVFVDTKGLDRWYKERLCRAIVAVISQEEHFDFNSLRVKP